MHWKGVCQRGKLPTGTSTWASPPELPSRLATHRPFQNQPSSKGTCGFVLKSHGALSKYQRTLLNPVYKPLGLENGGRGTWVAGHDVRLLSDRSSGGEPPQTQHPFPLPEPQSPLSAMPPPKHTAPPDPTRTRPHITSPSAPAQINRANFTLHSLPKYHERTPNLTSDIEHLEHNRDTSLQYTADTSIFNITRDPGLNPELQHPPHTYIRQFPKQ